MSEIQNIVHSCSDQIPVGSKDQALLGHYVWPWAKSLALQHDSYHCDLFAKSHPWPSRRREEEANNFVGAPVALNSTLDEPCPKKCRPVGGQEFS